MPPRAAGRRQVMFSSREPDSPSHQNSRSTFQKPNLPPLQGTPSSKRQYSYGADVEPMPSRPGHGLQRTQVRDISSAVRSALTRHEAEEDEHEMPKNPTFQKQSEQQTADAPPQGKYQPSCEWFYHFSMPRRQGRLTLVRSFGALWLRRFNPLTAVTKTA